MQRKELEKAIAMSLVLTAFSGGVGTAAAVYMIRQERIISALRLLLMSRPVLSAVIVVRVLLMRL